MPVPGVPRGEVILSIEVIRGFAALAVVVNHAVQRHGLLFETPAVGVDLFFVVSGLIMWTITASRPVTPGRFLLDRITRLAPPYVLLTLAIFALATLVPSAFPQMRTTLPHALLSVIFVPHVSPLGLELPLIPQGWTLNIEMFFYALVALALFLPNRRRLPVLTLGLVLLAAAGLFLRPGDAVARAYTHPLLLEFVAGLWLGLLWERRALPGPAAGWAMIAAGVAALLGWAVVLDTLPVLARPFAWGLPAALIVAGALAVEQGAGAGGIRPPRALLLLGASSYALYLTHHLVLGAAYRLIGGWGLGAYVVLATALSVLVALAFRRVVEVPLTRAVRRAVRRPAPFAALSTTSAGPGPARR